MALSYGIHIVLFICSLLKEFPAAAINTVDHINNLMLESDCVHLQLLLVYYHLFGWHRSTVYLEESLDMIRNVSVISIYYLLFELLVIFGISGYNN